MRIPQSLRSLFRDSFRACLDLFKVMVPIMIAVKIFKEFGLIQYIAAPLEPVMGLLGLPPEAGLVWATAMASNIYAALAVYAELLPQMGGALSVAKITVLSTVILIAHNLPLELRIAQKCGVSLRGQLAIRIGGALAAGLCIHWICELTGTLQDPAVLLWQPSPDEGPPLAWALQQARNLAMIAVVIFVIMACMRTMDALGATALLQKALRPALRFMGIGDRAATITVIGIFLGIAYGGGLIIHEARTGNMSRQDLFASLTLMGLSHALIEDTLLMLSVGASVWGVFWARLLFSLLAVALLTRAVGRWMQRPGGTSS